MSATPGPRTPQLRRCTRGCPSGLESRREPPARIPRFLHRFPTSATAANAALPTRALRRRSPQPDPTPHSRSPKASLPSRHTQVLVSQYHTLVADPLQTLGRMFAHLGLDLSQLSEAEVAHIVDAVKKEKADRRPSQGQEKMKTSRGASMLREDTQQMLNDFFSPFNEARRLPPPAPGGAFGPICLRKSSIRLIAHIWSLLSSRLFTSGWLSQLLAQLLGDKAFLTWDAGDKCGPLRPATPSAGSSVLLRHATCR